MSLDIPKFGFNPGRPENAGLFKVRASSFRHNFELAVCLVAPCFLSYPVSGCLQIHIHLNLSNLRVQLSH
jgi:hypothetical protein